MKLTTEDLTKASLIAGRIDAIVDKLIELTEHNDYCKARWSYEEGEQEITLRLESRDEEVYRGSFEGYDYHYDTYYIPVAEILDRSEQDDLDGNDYPFIIALRTEIEAKETAKKQREQEQRERQEALHRQQKENEERRQLAELLKKYPDTK